MAQKKAKSNVKKGTKKVKEEKNLFKRFLTSYKAIPNKKPYVEFFTALLTIPMLLTVVLLNYNTLTNNKNAKPTETPKSGGNIFVFPTNADKEPTQATTKTETVVVTKEACKKQLGPVSITSPREGETISDNPASLIVSYDDDEYCSAVWSYRINGGKWSEYDDKSLALYNLPQGNIKVELRVKSLASSDEKTLTRSFTYRGENNQPTVTAN